MSGLYCRLGNGYVGQLVVKVGDLHSWLVVCRMNGANVSPSHRRSPRKDAQRRRTRRCVKAEDAASGVEGRRDVAIIHKTDH